MPIDDEVSLPSALMPLEIYKERIRALGLRPRIPGYEGGSDGAWLETGDLLLSITHSGYGGGHGGDRPLRILSYRIDRPSAPAGSLVAEDAKRRALPILRALTAPAPAVHDYHPEAIRLRLIAFCDQVDITRCRVVQAPSRMKTALRGASIEERLLAYARGATELGVELSIYRVRRPPPFPVLFRGALEALSLRVSDVVSSIGASPIRVEAGSGAQALSVDDPVTIAHDTERTLSNRISAAKREGRFTRLEVDAIEVAPLTFIEALDVPRIKAQLEALAETADTFTMDNDGDRKEVKRKKLGALATVISAAIKAGKKVSIHPLGVRAAASELEF